MNFSNSVISGSEFASAYNEFRMSLSWCRHPPRLSVAAKPCQLAPVRPLPDESDTNATSVKKAVEGRGFGWAEYERRAERPAFRGTVIDESENYARTKLHMYPDGRLRIYPKDIDRAVPPARLSALIEAIGFARRVQYEHQPIESREQEAEDGE